MEKEEASVAQEVIDRLTDQVQNTLGTMILLGAPLDSMVRFLNVMKERIELAALEAATAEETTDD